MMRFWVKMLEILLEYIDGSGCGVGVHSGHWMGMSGYTYTYL